MKTTTAVLLALGSLLANTAAFGQAMNADDLKWINQCISDNKGGASADIVRKYCIPRQAREHAPVRQDRGVFFNAWSTRPCAGACGARRSS